MFYNSGPWAQCYKTFYDCNLLIFILSKSVCYNRLIKLAREKRSSQLQTFINYGHTQFFNCGPWIHVYETFYSRNLLIFILSQSVCYNRLIKLAREKRSSLLHPFINYCRIKFYNRGSWTHVYETLYGRNLLVLLLSQSVCNNRLKKLATEKRCSQLQTFINYSCVKFYNIGPSTHVYETFYGRNLLIFLLSQSFCYNMLKKLARKKRSNLLQKFVNYHPKKSFNIGP